MVMSFIYTRWAATKASPSATNRMQIPDLQTIKARQKATWESGDCFLAIPEIQPSNLKVSFRSKAEVHLGTLNIRNE